MLQALFSRFDPGHRLSQMVESIGGSPTRTRMRSWTPEPPHVLLHGSQIIIRVQLCTFPSLIMAEINRNCNEHTRSVKCSHFGIFSVLNRPYFVSQTIPCNALSQQFLGNQTPSNTTRDASMNKYIRVQELFFRLSREVSSGRLC